MHIWTLTNWEKYYLLKDVRSGLRLKFDKEVNSEVRRACKEFGKWLRKNYQFPMRVPIYIKSSMNIKASDGELVSAIFYEPYNRYDEPRISISTGDYDNLEKKIGHDNALAVILCSLTHELTHYYQWINNVKLTEIGLERQAKAYANFIVDEYSETREHP